ncbi:MAG TPA: hypothetical protein VJZ26_14505 [Blastocatellia bacterium]|nr:hypothetical protein [Blastocatellia bacterium]
MNEMMDMRGRLTLQLIDREGRVAHEQRLRNRIVKSGRDLVAKLFAGVPGGALPSRVTHMAVGINPTPEADDQTALLGERSPRKEILPADVVYSDFTESGTIGTLVSPTGPASTDRVVGGVRRVRVTLKTVFDFNEANGPEPLREAGIFNASAAGVMYNRVVFDAVTKTNAFKLTLIWDITF